LIYLVLTLLFSFDESLTGLVSITAGCGIVNFWAALLIGAVGGFVYLLSVRFMLSRMIDDAVEAIPVHLAGGMWGVVAVGLFAKPSLVRAAYGSDLEHFGWFFNLSDVSLLGSQLLEVLFITGWVSLTMFPLFGLLNYCGWFRVNALEEFVGLDTTYMTTEIINEENSDSNEEVRLAAYRQRFAERKQRRGGKDEINSVSISEECAPVNHRRKSSMNHTNI
jgi:ammonia channel protein AmtB